MLRTVLQDLFVGLPRALAAYREQGRFESWLKRIAARLALMRLRSARRRSEVSLLDVGDPPDRELHPLHAIELEWAIRNRNRSGDRPGEPATGNGY